MESTAQLRKMDPPDTNNEVDENAETVPLPSLQNQLFAGGNLPSIPSDQLKEIIELVRSVEMRLESLMEDRRSSKAPARKTAKKTTRKTAKRRAKKVAKKTTKKAAGKSTGKAANTARKSGTTAPQSE